jgi:hypothetical protein
MNNLRETAFALLDEEIRTISPVPKKREADMGGSGDAHEVDWADVSDVVKESTKQAFENTVQESLSKLEMDQVDEAHMPIKDLPEYRLAQEASEELGKAVTALIKKAHDEGMITKMGQTEI